MSAPFDPDLPEDNSLIVAAELRGQFISVFNNGDSRAFKPQGVDPLVAPISDPPTQAEVEELRDKINELLANLKA
jgi:hypothetical protein